MSMRHHAALLLSLMVLAGCATNANSPGASLPAQDSPQAQQALQQLRDDYNQGRYGAVIRSVALDGRLHDEASLATRTEAYKLQAFSYCVQDYKQLCEESFTRILQLQADYDLSPAEKGHPQWGPVFTSVQSRYQNQAQATR